VYRTVPSEKNLGFRIPACNQVRGVVGGAKGTGLDPEDDTPDASGSVSAEATVAANSGSASEAGVGDRCTEAPGGT
jgi:hypothetical protein